METVTVKALIVEVGGKRKTIHVDEPIDEDDVHADAFGGLRLDYGGAQESRGTAHVVRPWRHPRDWPRREGRVRWVLRSPVDADAIDSHDPEMVAYLDEVDDLDAQEDGYGPHAVGVIHRRQDDSAWVTYRYFDAYVSDEERASEPDQNKRRHALDPNCLRDDERVGHDPWTEHRTANAARAALLAFVEKHSADRCAKCRRTRKD